MSVYVVRHQHPAERCPAADFTDGAGLLNHLSPANAVERHGHLRRSHQGGHSLKGGRPVSFEVSFA